MFRGTAGYRRQRRADSLQTAANFVGDLGHLGIVGELHDRHRIHEAHGYVCIRVFTHDHIAWQQQADIGLSRQGAMRERRVTGAKDAVRRHVNVKLGFHRRLHVDVSQHAKAFGLQRVDHTGDGCPTVELLRDKNELSKSSKITDPWDSPYKIICGDEDITVLSFGPDKKEGTPDDIRIPDLAPAKAQ